MRRSTRDRLLLPILLPIGIIAAIVLLMVLFSRILLNTSADAATIVALVVSVTILVAASVVASRGHARGAAGLGSLFGVVAGVAMLAGGIALAVAAPAAEGGGGEGTEAFAAEITAPPGAAADGFDERVLSLPADEPIELTFHNDDPGVPHNVAISEEEDPSSPLLFAPDGTVEGPGTVTYAIDPLSEGSYHFFCEVHPTTMKGDVEVKPGGGGGPAEEGGGAVVAIAAQNLQYDKQELDFQADTPSTLEFDNQDAGIPHNVAIYEDDTLAKNLFSFDPFPGPAQQSFDVPGLPAGEFYFHCDVHPTMNGTVVVSGEGKPPGGGGPGAGGGAGGTEAAPPPEEPPPTSAEGAGGGEAASIGAQNLQFSTSTLSLQAGAETPLTFDNQDAGIPHNVSIYAADPASDPGAEQLFTFEAFPGPEERDFTIPALDAGTYVFQCDVHPTMKGDVRVS